MAFGVTSHRIEQTELFATSARDPEGFVYRANFISLEQERALVQAIERLAFSEVKMHGVTARRRTVHFGRTYDFETFKLSPAEEIPGFLDVVRERASGLTDWAAPDIEEALVTEYQPGAGIGWHRDAPQFGVIVGISLLGECPMQFRPWPHVEGRRQVAKPIAHRLAPRSVYVLSGAAREKWQHRILSTKTLRYSITFRSLRRSDHVRAANVTY